MGTLKALLMTASLIAIPAAHAESIADWRPYIVEASARFGVPSAWIEAVMRAESRGRTTLNGQPIRSSAGAIGLMQLMPATWADMRARLGLGSNPDDPRDNILAGTLYLRLMYDRFGYPGLFAAYNAGPGRYAEHLAGSRALPVETIGYLGAVAPPSSMPVSLDAKPAPPPPMFVVRRDVTADAEAPSSGQPPSLFVALSQRN